MNKPTCPFCNQPVKAQEQTISVDGELAHTQCSAKAGGESIYIPGADSVVPTLKTPARALKNSRLLRSQILQWNVFPEMLEALMPERCGA
jgi:hypothetical protein